jgi:excisionase family DNA binding protein
MAPDGNTAPHEKSSLERGVLLVGAARFELTTSCAQGKTGVLDGVSADGTGSQPLEKTGGLEGDPLDPVAPVGPRITRQGTNRAQGKRAKSGSEMRLLTVREVAAQLRVCSATVYKLVAAGRLPHVRVLNAVRVSADDLAQYVARREDGLHVP